LHLLSRPRRPRRPGEWTAATAVTFIVTLAASRSVTLAARKAGMSRKSAYALKGRDPAFAFAWTAAMQASQASVLRGPAPSVCRGDKVEEVDGPPVSPGQGHTSPSRRERERQLVQLLAVLRESPPLAPRAGAQ